MTDESERVSRRTALHALVSAPVASRRMFAKSPLDYSIALRPKSALLGERIVVVLSCVAREASEAVTFDDRNGTLYLRASCPDAICALAYSGVVNQTAIMKCFATPS